MYYMIASNLVTPDLLHIISITGDTPISQLLALGLDRYQLGDVLTRVATDGTAYLTSDEYYTVEYPPAPSPVLRAKE
jgi:hypothetical protein